MNDEEVLRMASNETSLWWYRGLRQLVIELLLRTEMFSASRQGGPPLALLDVGAGTGGMIRAVRETGLFQVPLEFTALDASRTACDALRRTMPDVKIVHDDAMALPFEDGAFDGALCLNVLEHESVDPAALLKGVHSVLRQGALLVVNVSAYQWLYSYHDVAVSQSRRFSRSEVRRLLEVAGFEVHALTYWNTVLFPAMVLARKWRKSQERTSDVGAAAHRVNRIGRVALDFERWLISHGIVLPFGGAVIALASRA